MSTIPEKGDGWDGSETLDGRISGELGLRFPEDWTLSSSWQRAQTERDRGGPMNDAQRVVWLTDSDTPHRVVWALEAASLRAECTCQGYRYNDFCAHLASLWWRWVRGRVTVTHLDTGRDYQFPPEWLHVQDADHETPDCTDPDPDLDGLTPAELDAFLTCELGTTGVREYARKTGRAPGTVGNLLARAREKEEGRK
jgi:hypothetical protein